MSGYTYLLTYLQQGTYGHGSKNLNVKRMKDTRRCLQEYGDCACGPRRKPYKAQKCWTCAWSATTETERSSGNSGGRHSYSPTGSGDRMPAQHKRNHTSLWLKIQPLVIREKIHWEYPFQTKYKVDKLHSDENLCTVRYRTAMAWSQQHCNTVQFKFRPN